MRGQVAAGDFANGPHAESTESAESLQPHFVGEEQIRRMSDHGNYTRARARAVKTFRTFRTFRSTVRLTKRRKLRAGASAATSALLGATTEGESRDQQTHHLEESVEKYRIVSGN